MFLALPVGLPPQGITHMDNRDNHKSDNPITEQASALGLRAKGAVKDATGSMTGNRTMEREGDRENAEGRARQASSDTVETNADMHAVGNRSGYVTSMYDSPESAGRACQSLAGTHGYKADDIDVLMADETRKRYFGDAKAGTEFSGGTKAVEGLGKGSAMGDPAAGASGVA